MKTLQKIKLAFKCELIRPILANVPPSIGCPAIYQFYRDPEGFPCLWDYQVKGWLRYTMNRVYEQKYARYSVKLNQMVNNMVYVEPRKIRLVGDADRMPDVRHQTLAGFPSVVVNVWEEIDHASFDVKFLILDADLTDKVRQAMKHSEYFGLGAWRNAGRGTFRATEVAA